jgi:hypothetical protein
MRRTLAAEQRRALLRVAFVAFSSGAARRLKNLQNQAQALNMKLIPA